jgi:hypothetical protein
MAAKLERACGETLVQIDENGGQHGNMLEKYNKSSNSRNE